MRTAALLQERIAHDSALERPLRESAPRRHDHCWRGRGSAWAWPRINLLQDLTRVARQSLRGDPAVHFKADDRSATQALGQGHEQPAPRRVLACDTTEEDELRLLGE